ncbi:MAG: hypothetical protein ACOCXT_01395 [Candidatus Dojkabacteria bacterium]
METTIQINNMHCEACKSLILIELEDAGCAKKVVSIELREGSNGLLQLTGVTQEDVDKIKEIINATEQYSVEESA